MARGKYRKIYDYTVEDIKENNSDYYCEKDDVISMIDDIETRVKEINFIVDGIKGIEIIDEIKKLLEELAVDLY
jgi:hypothetical protein